MRIIFCFFSLEILVFWNASLKKKRISFLFFLNVKFIKFKYEFEFLFFYFWKTFCIWNTFFVFTINNRSFWIRFERHLLNICNKTVFIECIWKLFWIFPIIFFFCLQNKKCMYLKFFHEPYFVFWNTFFFLQKVDLINLCETHFRNGFWGFFFFFEFKFFFYSSARKCKISEKFSSKFSQNNKN